jgi:HPt (histidine-containing phosphotransfer) domain-containing protein
MMPNQSQHLNLQVWKSLIETSGSAAYLVEMIDHFFFIGPMRVSRIRNSHEILDLQSLSSEARTLKTASLALGLDELARLSHRLELNASQSVLDEMPTLIASIETKLADILCELKEYRAHF